MAGGGGGMALPERVKRGSKAHKKKHKKRLGFVLDMTPLVDVAFLLLTFFMFTTSMITPQVMEMSIPPEQDVDIQVNENNLYSIFIREDGKIFTRLAKDEPIAIDVNELQNQAVTNNMMRKNELITVLKSERDAPYGTVIQVLDKLNVAEGMVISELRKNGEKRERKFTIAKITDEEIQQLKGLN